MKRTGFVLLPDRRVQSEAIRLSQQIPGNKIQLGLEMTRPHATILQTFFKPNFDYMSALKELKGYEGFRQEPRTLLQDIRLENTHHVKSITWWNLNNSQWLKNLNKTLIETYEEQIIKPEADAMPEGLTPAASESFLRTGYSRNLEAYEPHITLGVSDEAPPPLASDLAGTRARFHELAYAQHGENGVIEKVLGSVFLPMTWD